MRFYEFKTPLFESARGLAARKQGDRFVSKGGPDLMFDEIAFYPNSGGYKEEGELEAEIAQAEEDYGYIIWRNNPIKGGGFAVATFVDEKGDVHNYGRFLKVIKAIHQENKWPNTDIPGYRYDSGAGAKETANMQPSEVLTSFDNLTPSALIKQIGDKFGGDHVYTKVAKIIASKRKSKFPLKFPAPADGNFEAFRDYFCEMLHPLALMSHSTSGNADDAEKQFMKGSSFNECTISFSTSKTEGLSDSVLVNPNGHTVKVSSKGKAGGAQASVKNLVEQVRDLKDPKLIKKHKPIIELIDNIVAAGVWESPSVIGLHFKLINKNEAGLITRMKEMVRSGEMTFDSVMKGKHKKYLTARLQKLFVNRAQSIKTAPASVNAHAHMVAALAFYVADHVNNNTNFGEAAADILNNAGLVTVDTKAKKVGDQWEITDFVSKFPGESITNVLFSAQKNYASTNVSGNFTFAILKNNADPDVFADAPPKPEPKTTKKKKPAGKTTARAGGKETKKKGGSRGKR